MKPTEFIWQNGSFVPWMEAKAHVLTYGLHYGGAVFEGIRAYATERGPAIFRLKEHYERFKYSAGSIQMDLGYTPEELGEATLELVRKNKLDACYIRPIAFFGYGKMGLHAKGCPTEIAIASWEWGAYLGKEMVDVIVPKTRRISPKTLICDAKVSGHYVNSWVALREIDGSKYDEVLMLDVDGYIAEGSGENVFFIKEGKLYTPALGTILAGITRATIIGMAKDEGLEVVEGKLGVDEMLGAQEAFFTGTACEVNAIRSINDTVIGTGSVGPVTKKLKDLYFAAVTGKALKYQSFLSFVR